MGKKINALKKATAAIALSGMCCLQASAQSGYVTGDFHQHTTYTDGSYTIGHMMEMSNKYGLDWWANSEHGGAGNRWAKVSGKDLGTVVTWDKTAVELKGKENGNNMWRWQSLTELSFKDVLLYRRVFPDKMIIQGYEMNVPGHEHASMGLIGNQFDATNPDVNALAQFEYLFDANDKDDSQPLGITEAKSMTNNHGKAVAAVTWLQKNYPTESWVVPAHPERYRYTGATGYNIEHFRDMNNAAPDVFFGFESLAGHQKGKNRGEYGNATNRPPHGSYGLGTYGGAGWMTAKVGGLWDAMLSEGRRFWVFASSDSHAAGDNDADFYPGEYQKTYTFVAQKNDPHALVDGLRSGNSYVVHGDLIDSLTFTAGNAVMGSTLATSGNEVEVYIKVRDPQGENFNTYSEYTNPVLNHIDLIAGVVGGKAVAPSAVPADGITGYSDAYKKDSVETTRVIARFGAEAAAADDCGVATTAWTDLGNGWKEMRITVQLSGDMYFRLRGTNLGLGVAGETDKCGNPLIDVQGENTPAKAFEDLWFYSNPVFVKNNNAIRINEFATNGATQLNGMDWVELYNASDKAVTLSGYVLDDAKSANEGTSAHLDNITIPAKGFVILVEGEDFSYGLGASGETLSLKANGVVVDQITCSPNIAGKTLGRISDGEGSTNVTFDGTEANGWKLFDEADVTIGASNNTITFIYTSDQHYGITRPDFRGARDVDATVVNAALVEQMNTLNEINFPEDGGVNSGKQIADIRYVIQTGDISNRAESGIAKSAVTLAQFDKDYTNGITLQNVKGEKPALFLLPGNHDVSNTVGHAKIAPENVDATTIAEIYNRMMNPETPKTAETYDYVTDKINYIKIIGGIQFVFINMWPDQVQRAWMDENIDPALPAFIFTHDQPDVEAKHFIDPAWVEGTPVDFSRNFEYEYLLDQMASQLSSSGSTEVEQREFAAFIRENPNIKAYFHGNDNHNEFYTYTGPDNDISLPTYRIDSPMKGNISGDDESKLSFQVVTIDRATRTMTVRECLWNTTGSNDAPIVFGEISTINY